MNQMPRVWRTCAGLACLLFFGCASKDARHYVERGRAKMAARRYDDAVLDFRKAAQKDPNLGDAYRLLAEAHLNRNDATEAFQALTRAAALMPQNAEVARMLADLSFEGYLTNPQRPKALYDHVVAMSDRLLRLDPNSFDGMRLKGKLRLLDQNPHEAVAYLDKAHLARPHDADTVLSLGQALAEDNQRQRASKVLEDYLGRDASHAAITDVLYRLYLGERQWEKAEALLLKYSQANPNDAQVLLRLAEYFEQSGKPERAAQTMKRLEEDRKRFPEGRLTAGDYYSAAGKWEEAAAQYLAGARENPDKKDIYRTRSAGINVARGDYSGALNHLAEILREAPNSEDAHVMRAQVNLRIGSEASLPAAVSDFRWLVARNPGEYSYRNGLGNALALSGQAQEAIAAWKDAIRLNPKAGEPRFAMAGLMLTQGQYGEALRYADELMALDGSKPQSRLLRARCLMRVGRLVEARGELNRLSGEFPQSAEILLQLGTLAVHEEKLVEAEALFQRARELNPGDDRSTAALAETLGQRNDFEKAIGLLTRKAGRSEAATRRVLATLYARSGNYQAAAQLLEQLRREEPASPQWCMRLGEAYERLHQAGKAVPLYEEALRLDPDNREAGVLYAEALRRSGARAQALEFYRKLHGAGSDPLLMNNIADLLIESRGDLAEATRLAQAAVHKAPGQPNYLDTLAWGYLKRGMVDEASPILAGLVQKHPANSTFRYHLGEAHLAKGDKPKARKELESALEAKPDPAEAALIRDALRRAS